MTALITLAALCSCGRKEFVKEDDAVVYGGLFDTSRVHRIEVEIPAANWQDLLANPLEKTKYSVSVTIDGNRLDNVSFSTKGNTSLRNVAASDSDRYSFKLNFGKYEEGQTYFGLDKLNLNNLFADSTYMKDYLSYTIMRKAGVEAPLISYTELIVNGEARGLYIAIENVSDSFLKRISGSDSGALFKPETEWLTGEGKGGEQRPEGGGQRPEGTFDPNMPMPSGMPEPPEGGGQGGQGFPGGQGGGQGFPGGPNGTPDPNMPMPSGMPEPPEGGGQGFPGGQGGGQGSPGGQGFPGMNEDSGGADLKYIDGDRSSYPAIFDNEENEVSNAERRRLISALKSLTDGKNADKYWNIEEVCAYFAAHDFVLNFDSYTGTMLHNYYLYLNSGRVSMLPWDYNLAFGGFAGVGDAVSAINHPIDSPLSGTTEDARPLWKLIAQNEDYLKLYHEKYEALIEGFFESGECSREIERVRALIAPYVAEDPTAFCTAEVFETAVDTLAAFTAKRAESVRLQLDGKLGSGSGTQNAADMVPAEGMDLRAMGSMGGGGDRPNDEKH